MICPKCGLKLRWECDYDFEDVGREGVGVCSVYTCVHCGVEVEIYMPEEYDKKNNQ